MRNPKLCLYLSLISLLCADRAWSDCGFPGPKQVIIYQHKNRGGACAVLEIGKYPRASAFGLGNDSISAIDVGGEVRAVLYEDNNFGGRQAHFEGGFYYDPIGSVNNETSSIEIFPQQGGPAATFFLGNHPRNRENFWSENAQGIANDGANWFISITGQSNNTPTLFKIPFSYNLNRGSEGRNPRRGMPSQLSSRGYDHFGDLDQRDGFLFVPVTGGGPPQIAVFSTSGLEFLSSATIDIGGGWVAIRPGSKTLWVSDNDINEDSPIHEYKIDWDSLRRDGTLILKSPPKKIFLLKRDGTPARLQTMQGGVFNHDGTLLYVSSGYCDTFGFIDVFFIEGDTGILQASSENGYGPFNFETHPAPLFTVFDLCQGEEAEGLDFLDVRGLGIPGIPDGQLHAILVSNDLFEDDDVYLKHYKNDNIPAQTRGKPDLIATETESSFTFCDVVGGQLGVVARVQNVGGIFAAASTTKVDFFEFGSIDVPTPGIPPDTFVDIGPIEPPPGCFSADCGFRITVDSGNNIDEASEINNNARGQCLG